VDPERVMFLAWFLARLDKTSLEQEIVDHFVDLLGSYRPRLVRA
jgi:hypothetical protein